MTQGLPTLEYRRLERARKIAVRGLRLLGLLTTLASLGLFVMLIGASRSGPGVFRHLVLIMGVFGGALALGLAKFFCAVMIDRRSRVAAGVALGIMAVEIFLLSWLLKMFASELVGTFLDPLAIRLARVVATSVALAGWLGVTYEIVHVLRHRREEG